MNSFRTTAPGTTGEAEGLTARRAAVRLLSGVLDHKRTFDVAFDHAINSDRSKTGLGDGDPRDRSFAQAITLTTLRRLGEIDATLDACLAKPLPRKARAAQHILRTAVAQLSYLDVPAHAAIDSAVRLAKADPSVRHLSKLVNAVLRTVQRGTREPRSKPTAGPGEQNTPEWLFARWVKSYGPEDAEAIAASHLDEPGVDLSLRNPGDAAAWAERLGGRVLATGSVRLLRPGRIDALEGYRDGAWWVQDAAAALPARLFGDIAGKDAADFCAAPGGKTAQLAAAGATVTAVDHSGPRLAMVQVNLERLGLSAACVKADLRTWDGPQFDAILLDAPCSATGTIRRRPDLPYLKRATDIAELALLQSTLLARSVRMLKPGGTLVFCTCSLEPEEGPDRIAALLASEAGAGLRLVPVEADELGIPAPWVTGDGALRTLPHFAMDRTPASRVDGFFAVRLRRV